MAEAACRRRRVAIGMLFTFVACSIDAATFAQRRVVDVLHELRASGFVFIYSTHVLPAQSLVKTEPHATEGLELAREILGQYQLALIEAAPNVYSIARAPAPPQRGNSAPVRPVAPQAVEEVVVQTSRYEISNEYFTNAPLLTQEQLNDLPHLADETLRAIQRLPGSASNGFSSVGPVRGGEPQETAIILDGLRLYEPFHLKNFLSPVSLLDSRLIEGIEFYSGGFPAIYGDRMSAVIDARSVRPGQPRYVELGLNLFHASALGSMEFADGRGHALLSARRSNVGDLVQFSEQDFGEPNYSDGFGRIDYDFSASTSGSLDFLVSSDGIDAIRAHETQHVRDQHRNVYAWATLDHDWSAAANSKLILSFTDLSNTRRGSIDEPGRVASVIDDRLFHVLGLRWENSLGIDRFEHRFGIEGRRLWGEYTYLSDMTRAADFPSPGSPAARTQRSLSPEPDGYETLAYWDVRADLSSRWTVQTGIRVDTQTYDGSGDGEQWSPRVSVLYAFSPQSHLRASWGRFHQAQGINELQVEDGVERFYRAQHADHLILGFEHAFDAGLDLRLEAYRKEYRRIRPRFENLFDPLVLFPEAEFDRVMIAPDSARAVGLEALVRLRPRGAWSGWLSYAWSRVEDSIDGRDIPRSWDQRNAINLGVVWSSGPWTAAVTNSYHTGWPTTEFAFDPSSSIPAVSVDRRNRRQFSDYNSLDFRITRIFSLSHGTLDVFLEASNALSQINPCCVQYEVTENADGTVSRVRDVDSWLPLVPSAGVLWRY